MNYYYMAMRGSLVIGLNTDLDHHLADEIREVIDEVVEERGIRSIIFDFSKVTFMDSSGIGIIIGRYRKISCFGGKVYAIHADERIRRILKASGMSSIIEVLA